MDMILDTSTTLLINSLSMRLHIMSCYDDSVSINQTLLIVNTCTNGVTTDVNHRHGNTNYTRVTSHIPVGCFTVFQKVIIGSVDGAKYFLDDNGLDVFRLDQIVD